jgi:pyruvate/2-oxoglutarate/acetoin dehydrogenase E1 component
VTADRAELLSPVPYSKPLEEYVLPNVEKIVRAARKVLAA